MRSSRYQMQLIPPTRKLCEKSEIPPTAVGGLFILNLQTGAPDSPFSLSFFPLAARGERRRENRERRPVCLVGWA